MRLVIDLHGAQGTSRTRGIGRYSRELALAMAREARGHEVIVALSGAMPEAAEELAAAFAGILPRHQIRVWDSPRGVAVLQRSPARTFAQALRAQFLASLRPDLVHVSSLFEGLGDDVVSMQPSHLERLPVVATCYDLIPFIRHHEYFGDSGPLSAGTQWYYQCLQEMTLCEGLLAISESSRQEAIRHLAYPSNLIFNVQAGISPDFRAASLTTEARAALLRRYGLRESFILFLGAGDIRKNEAGLLEAYARLPADLRDRHQLLIVGRTDEATLRQSAARLHVPGQNLVLIPFIQEGDLNALYSTCGLFVFPSLHEGFGLPAAEAMACGAPTIASNTTSLPEVIGRPDATFDPGDPDSIAASMRKVLEDSAFRDELAAHGPVQAGRFTWQASAARAWDALETTHAGRLEREIRRPAGILSPRKRLAFVSPLPPQASGIADYSRDLLPSLARFYDITLVAESEVTDARIGAAFPRLDPSDFLHTAASFDRVLYQVGNSSFHRFQIEDLLPSCPGVVVLHDAFLSDYAKWLLHEQGRPDDFRGVLLRSHGYPALRYDTANGRTASLAHFPCCLPVLQAAIGVIQHSWHGVDVLRQHFGGKATDHVSVIPLLRADRARPDRATARRLLGLADDVFVVCSFGVVTSQKCPRLVADAWRLSGVAGRMVFAGDASTDWREALADPPAEIICTGRLSPERYDAWLSAADLAVQWRTGSRGESSAAVADALLAGLPLIVNRHGSAAELPDVAFALPDEADSHALAAAIVSLHGDAASRHALSAAARAYAALDLAPGPIAMRYHDAIEQAYATDAPAVMARRLGPESVVAASSAGGLTAASRGIAFSFPQIWRAGGHPRLLIDMSELSRRDGNSGIQRVVREITRRALVESPGGRRVDAVRAHEGRLRETHAAPLRILGHSPLTLPETALDAGFGDILLCADVNAELTQAEFDDMRRLRLAGMRIILVVYDLLPVRHPELFPTPIATLVAEWYRRMLTIADAVACISRAVADDVAAWLDDAPDNRKAPLPIGVFHLGSDFHAEDDRTPISPNVAAAIESARQRPTIVMAGTIEPRKGYAQALAAFETLWQAGEATGLTIVGKQGWQTEALVADMRASPHLGDRLHWLPECTDAELRQVYRTGTGLLMASHHEGFGLPIIEAAHARLPILARDIPVFREIAGDHARYFTGVAAADLARALLDWKQQDFTPASHGMNALTWDDSFRQLCAVVLDERYHTTWRPSVPPSA